MDLHTWEAMEQIKQLKENYEARIQAQLDHPGRCKK